MMRQLVRAGHEGRGGAGGKARRRSDPAVDGDVMKHTVRWLGSATLVGIILIRSAHGAVPPVDVTGEAIRCSTVTATLSISPPLAFAGTATSVRMKIKGKLDGCEVVTKPEVLIDSGTFQGTLVLPTNECMTLTSTQAVTGSLTYRWKANLETPIVPTASVQEVSRLTGFPFDAGLAIEGFGGASYLGLSLGASSVSGAFTGGDAGATSSVAAVTSENSTFFVATCRTPGIRTLHLGIGSIALR
jgi:hypothetical protein